MAEDQKTRQEYSHNQPSSLPPKTRQDNRDIVKMRKDSANSKYHMKIVGEKAGGSRQDSNERDFAFFRLGSKGHFHQIALTRYTLGIVIFANSFLQQCNRSYAQRAFAMDT